MLIIQINKMNFIYNDGKIKLRRIVMHKLEVKTIGHDWKVLEKKIVNKINYYLLQDCSPKKIESKRKIIPNPIHVDIPLFLLVKESKGEEHFSGRFVYYEDVNKKIKVKKELDLESFFLLIQFPLENNPVINNN